MKQTFKALGMITFSSSLNYQVADIERQTALTGGTGEWICKTAKTVEEAKSLIEQGFEYVTEMKLNL
ncbi:MAG: hypothetical protein QW660_04090 [Candidatus Bathyarchaeia archaeon]